MSEAQQQRKVEIPVNSEELEETPSWARNSAETEERAWNELEETKRSNDKRWLASYGWIVVIFSWCFSLIFLAALISWAWHYIAHPSWHWLGEQQLSKIQSVLFSGGMGAIVSSIIRAQLGKA